MRRYAVLALVTALLAGGCGIPDDTDVRVIGPGPSAGFATGDDSAPSEPPARESATDPEQLVTNYLKAAAGDPDGALNRVKAYLSDAEKSGFEAGPDIRVIRLTDEPLYTPGDPEISVNAQEVGTLRNNGVLEPSLDSAPKNSKYKFQVSPVAGQSGFFITSAPPKVLLLTDTALNDYFLRRTIYFWNSDNTTLIPDLRYMPRVPRAQQPTTILNWLVNGPAPWLGDTARGLPDGTIAPDNVPAATNDTLQVSLSAQAVPSGDGQALERLRRQLQWSLRDLLPRNLELKIGNQDPVRYNGLDFHDSNLASRLVAEDPERFAIYGGSIRRLTGSPQSGDPVPVLKAADNKGFSAAALSTSATHTYLAAVAGTGDTRKLRVAVARNGQQNDLTDVSGLTGDLGRPVWAVTPDNDPSGAIGLITKNERLYSFGVGRAATAVPWQGDPGPIQAVSVAPDGSRIALVAGGKLYRTMLDTSGDTLTLSAPERLLPANLSSVTAVAWSSETYLAVAGARADGRSAVMDVSIDGALTDPVLTDIGKETVTYLAAYPANPLSPNENAASESYETASAAWDVLGEPVKITAALLAPPAPSPPAGSAPTSPFFLD
jgi:hypothetical protein